ncbi:MAG: hypothetical protein NTW19_05260 [Planctomycetota bacterium]|nr:hypothetical protein [Planctomycetota bacterium]
MSDLGKTTRIDAHEPATVRWTTPRLFAALALLAAFVSQAQAAPPSKTPTRPPTKPPAKAPEAAPAAVPVAAPAPAPGVENLIRNGDFEQPNDTNDGPKFWQPVDNLVYHWATDAEAPERGKVIKIDTGVHESQAYDWWTERFVKGAPLANAPAKTPGAYMDSIGALDGGFFWSDYIPIKPDKAYMVYVDVKGGGCKVFVRGYEKEVPLSFADEEPATQQVFRQARNEPENDASGKPIRYRLRYSYTKWFSAGGGGKWQTYSLDKPAHPTSRELTKNVRFLRVMLYPYWPNGEYMFDNVRVVEVPADADQANPTAATEADYKEGKVARPAMPATQPASAPAH